MTTADSFPPSKRAPARKSGRGLRIAIVLVGLALSASVAAALRSEIPVRALVTDLVMTTLAARDAQAADTAQPTPAPQAAQTAAEAEPEAAPSGGLMQRLGLAEAAPALQSPAQKPTVSQMPQSTVPVHRAGIDELAATQ